MNIVTNYVHHLPLKRFETFGFVLASGKWTQTKETRSQLKTAMALDFVLRNVFQQEHVFAVRLGRGVPRYPPHDVATHSTLIVWSKDPAQPTIHDYDRAPAITMSELHGPSWESLYSIQALSLDTGEVSFSDATDALRTEQRENDEVVSNNSANDGSGRVELSDHDRLSVIPEESIDEEDYPTFPTQDTLPESLPALSRQAEGESLLSEELWAQLAEQGIEEMSGMAYVSLQDMTDAPPEVHQHLPHDERVRAIEGSHYFTSGADPSLLNSPNEQDDDGNHYVELLFPDEFAKLLVDAPPPPGGCARL